MMRRWKGSVSQEQPAGDGNNSTVSGGSDGNRDGRGGSHEVAPGGRGVSHSDATSAPGDLFGGMELVRTRHRRTAGSTAGSRTPLADSLAPMHSRGAPPYEAPPEEEKPFVARFNLQLGTVQDEVEDPKAAQMRQRLQRFYDEYNPSMLAQVESTIKAFLGREDELFRSLVTQYGPEPTLLQASALPKGLKCFHGAESEVGSAFDFVACGARKEYEGSCSSTSGNCNAVNIAEVQSFPFLQGEGSGAHVQQATTAGAGFNFIDRVTKAQPAFVFTAATSSGENGGEFDSVAPPPVAGAVPRESELELEEEDEGFGVDSEKDEEMRETTFRLHCANDLDSNRTNKSPGGSENGEREDGGLWERQRREIHSSQEDVLLAQERLCRVLGDICASIEQRHDLIGTLSELEGCMDQCVTQEAFEQADVLCRELEQLGGRMAELDAEPGRLVTALDECGGRLDSAVRGLAVVLQRHRKELLESRDDEERHVDKFIHDATARLENHKEKVAVALEQAKKTEESAVQKAKNLRELKSKARGRLVEHCDELRSLQEKLQCEKDDIDAEIEVVEAKLSKLRQASASKAAALQNAVTSIQDLMTEHELREAEVDMLIEEEEGRQRAAAAGFAQLQQNSEGLLHEWRAFNTKKEAMLSELRSDAEKIDAYEKRRMLLETETLAAVRTYSDAVVTLLRMRSAGAGVLFVALPFPYSAGYTEESPLVEVQRLQQKLHDLDVGDEKNKAIVASLGVRLGEMHNNVLALEMAKRSAVQAKRFKEAQLKAEEVRALTVSMEELTARTESAQVALRENESERASLQQELAVEQARAVGRMHDFLSRYGAALSATMEATATLAKVLQLAGEEESHGNLVEVVQRLIATLQDEYQHASQPGEFGGGRGAAVAVEEESPATGEKLTGGRLAEELSALLKRQEEAVGMEDYEECEALQHKIDIIGQQLCAMEAKAGTDLPNVEEPK